MPLDWYPTAEKFETTKLFPGNQGRRAVCIHIAEGSYAAAVRWLQDAQLNPNSSAHFVIAQDGRVAQLVSVNDGAWANGLRWNADAAQPNGGFWTNTRGVRVSPTWQDIVPGQNPNFYTLSIEHEGFYQQTWTAEMYAANNALLVWLAEQFDIWWVPYRSLIGHYAIDNIDRANCPGPHVNLETMAADANTTRLLKMVVPQSGTKHIYGTTALLSLPTQTVITQLRDTDVDIYGYVDFSREGFTVQRWYITPYSFNNRQPNFFEAAATVPTARLFPSLCLNPGFRDAVTPPENELRELAPQWLRVLLFAQYQNFSTGQNTELDWLLERVNAANANIKILALVNLESLGQTPPSDNAEWNSYVTTASNLAQRVAQFYRGKIHALQIWNEPDVQKIPPERYAALLNAAYPKIKAVNPDVLVVSAGICCGEGFDYLRAVTAAAPNAFDFAGWHLYAERADGFPFANWGLGELRHSINTARAIAGRPLWITEIGAQLAYNWGTLSPPQAVADYMRRAFAILDEVGRNQVTEAFWFTWRESDNVWGLVDNARSQRPAWFAFQQLAQHAPPPPDGTVEITNVTLAPTLLDAGQILNVSITVRNGSNATLATQAPNPNFTYLEGESFLAHGFVEQRDAFRVGIDFDARTGIDHPYRWGFGAPLNPGETRVIHGAIRLNRVVTQNYWAGLVREQVSWLQDHQGATNIAVHSQTPPPVGKPRITNVQFMPTTLEQGQIVQVKVTVKNDSSQTLVSQGPNVGFLYNEGDNFLTKGFAPVQGTWRVGVDYEGRGNVDAHVFPYRWGLGTNLAPGQSAVVVGFVRLNRRQSVDYWAGLIQEENNIVADRAGVTQINVVKP